MGQSLFLRRASPDAQPPACVPALPSAHAPGPAGYTVPRPERPGGAAACLQESIGETGASPYVSAGAAAQGGRRERARRAAGERSGSAVRRWGGLSVGGRCG